MTLVARTVNGVDVLVDDGATGDVQTVRLMVGAVGSEVIAPGDSTGGLLVQVPSRAASSATLSNQADQATNVTLLASNAARKGVIIHNDSPSILYVKYGATATVTSWTVKMPADSYWEMPLPIYTGQIDGIWSADSTGSARITEM